MSRTVAIDVFAESVARYPRHTVAVFDVIRATTTAVTAVGLGRRVYPVESVEAAAALARQLDDPFLVGEVHGDMPAGFDLHNSPAAIDALGAGDRPLILLSTSGMPLLVEAGPGTYVGALRNYAALGRFLATRHERVALIGAGTRGEFREEDQLACSWTAEILLEHGFEPENAETLAIVERWRGKPVEALTVSNSVGYLRRSGQLRDLDFVLEHVDDLDVVVRLAEGILEIEQFAAAA